LTEYYLDIESTGFSFIENEIILIQVGESLRPDGLRLFRSYSLGGEEGMLRAFLAAYPSFLQDGFGFVPIGFNLCTFDLPFLYVRMKKYHLLPEGFEYWMLARKPTLDLKMLTICLNHGNFRGTALDKWSAKKTNGEEAVAAIASKDWERLERYVAMEYDGFLEFRSRAFKITIPKIEEESSAPVIVEKKEKPKARKEGLRLPPADQQKLRLWYSRPDVQFEIVKQMRFRYLSCKKADHFTPHGDPVFVRYYMCYTVDLLKKAIEHLGLLQENCKPYYDLALWSRTEFISWNSNPRQGDEGEPIDSKRRAQIKALEPHLEMYFRGMNFPIDLDAPSQKQWKKAHTEAKKVKAFLDSDDSFLVKRFGKKPPYRLSWSGKKGFHFEIPLSYFSPKIGEPWAQELHKWANLTEEQRAKILKPKLLKAGEEPAMRAPSMIWVENHLDIALKIENELGLLCMDHSVYDRDRVFALPYSLSEVGLVVLPLTDEEFEKFDPAITDPLHVVKHIKVQGRGLLWRNT
jgi:hypothetical protein